MPFRHPPHRIQEILAAPKCLRDPSELRYSATGLLPANFKVDLDFVDAAPMDLRFCGSAGDRSRPETYRAAFLVDAERVRSIDYSPIQRRNMRRKLNIPKGWHENVVDPTRSTVDPAYNRHVPLEGFDPGDFVSFTRRAADRWRIDLDWETELWT